MTKKCSVESCNRVAVVNGMCGGHNDRRESKNGLRPEVPLGGVWTHNFSNPWRGELDCPACHSSYWTMPYDGVSESSLWLCHDHGRTIFFHRELFAA